MSNLKIIALLLHEFWKTTHSSNLVYLKRADFIMLQCGADYLVFKTEYYFAFG